MHRKSPITRLTTALTADHRRTSLLHASIPAGLPETAEEYLQWVRYEASRCPRVVRAEVKSDNLASTASGILEGRG